MDIPYVEPWHVTAVVVAATCIDNVTATLTYLLMATAAPLRDNKEFPPFMERQIKRNVTLVHNYITTEQL